MSTKEERASRLVAQINVLRADGKPGVVEEVGEFRRVLLISGKWTDWVHVSSRLLLRGEPVNATDDPGKLQVAMTGELLTVISPGRSPQ